MNKQTTSTGIGFSGLLTIVFIVLKLTKVIDWSWWWVLSPAWIPTALVVGIFVVIVLITLITCLIDLLLDRRYYD